jgi:hypothetical protein
MTEAKNFSQNETRTKLAQNFKTSAGYISEAKRIQKENPIAFEAIKSGQKKITEVVKEEKIQERICPIYTVQVLSTL